MNKFNFSRVLIIVFYFCFSPLLEALELVEGKYKVMDTGVSYTENRTNITWLNSHLLLISFYTDGRSGQVKKDTQTILFDTKTKKKSILYSNMAFMCKDKKSNISKFKNMTNNEVRFFNLSEDGKLTELSQPIDAEQFKCSNITPNRERLQAFLLDEESYIDSGKSGNGGKEQAILYLKNKAPIELPFRGHVVDHARYIPF